MQQEWLSAIDGFISTAANRALGRSRRIGALERLDAQLSRAHDQEQVLLAFDHLLVSLAGLLLPDGDVELGRRAAASLGLLGVIQPDRFIESMFHRLHQVQHPGPQALLVRAVHHLLGENAAHMPVPVQAQAAAHALLHGMRLLHDLERGGALLPALCGMVGSIAVHHPRAVLPHLPALTDLLLGWSLQPQGSDWGASGVDAICAMFADMGVLWCTNSAYTVDLLFSICGDVDLEIERAQADASLACQLPMVRCAAAIARTLPGQLLGRHEHEHTDAEPAAGGMPLGQRLLAVLLQLRPADTARSEEFHECVIALASLPCGLSAQLYGELARVLLWERATTPLQSYTATCAALDTHAHAFERAAGNLTQHHGQALLQGCYPSSCVPQGWSWSPLRRLRLCVDAAVLSRVLELYVSSVCLGCTARVALLAEVQTLVGALRGQRSVGDAGGAPLALASGMGDAELTQSDVETLLVFDLSVLRVAAQRSADPELCAELCFGLRPVVELLSQWPGRAPPTVSLAMLVVWHAARVHLLPSGLAPAVSSEWVAAMQSATGASHDEGTTEEKAHGEFSHMGAQRLAASQLWKLVLVIWGASEDHSFPVTLRLRAAEMALEELRRGDLPLPTATAELVAAMVSGIGADCPDVLRSAAACVLSAVAGHPGLLFSSEEARFLFEALQLTLGDSTPAVRAICMDAVVGLAAGGARRWDRCSPEKFALRRNRFLSSVSVLPMPKSAMLPSLFKRMMDYIIGNTASSLHWIRDCYLVTTNASCADAGHSDEVSLLSWCAAACARFCVTSRLRTHFGTPAQTFTGVERVTKGMSAPFGRYEVGVRAPSVTPLRLLLLFCERLEGEMLRAGRETPPSGSKSLSQSTQFFKANQRVVGDWLHRMRPHLLNASTQCGAIGPTIRNAVLRLRDVRRSALSSSSASSVHQVRYELDTCLHPLCSALCFLRDCDAIKGLCTFSTAFLTRVNQGGSRDDNKVPWLYGLYLQSQGRFEEATQEYRAAMRALGDAVAEVGPGSAAGAESYAQSKTLFGTSLTTTGVEHLVNSSVDCYLALGDWASLEGWVTELEHTRAKVRGLKDRHLGPLISVLEPQFGTMWLRARALLEVDGLDAARSSAAHLVPDCVMPDVADIHSCMRLSDRLRLQGILRADGGKQLLSDARSLLEGPLAVAALDAPSPMWVEPLLCSLHFVDAEMGDRPAFWAPGCPVSCAGQDGADSEMQCFAHGIGTLGELLRIHDRREATTSDGVAMQQSNAAVRQLAGMARKHSNTQMAQNLLRRSDCASNGTHQQRWRLYEDAKLLEINGRPLEAVVHLWQLLAGMSSGAQPQLASHQLHVNEFDHEFDPEHFSDSEWQAKVLLQLSRNFRGKREHLGSPDAIVALEHAGILEGSTQSTSASARLDEVSGRCLATAAHIAPLDASSWAAYSSWCYQRGVRDVNFAQGEEKVDESEHEAVGAIVSRACPCSDILAQEEAVRLLVRDVVCFREVVVGREEVRTQVCAICGSDSEDTLDALLDIRERVRSRVLAFVRLAVTGYFRYLRLSRAAGGSGASVDASTACEDEAMQMNSTLRLLRMLVKFGSFLRQEFDDGLSETPIAPWRQIVPQLLARLGHPRPFVAQQVEALLLRLADAEPSLLVYHAVAGVPSEAPSSHSEGDGNATGRIERVKAALQRSQPQLIAEVECLMHEMTRMTGLWDERLSILIHSLTSDVSRRLKALAEEVTRAASNVTLTEDEKVAIARHNFVAVMRQPYSVLQAWWNTVRETQGQPETPHEARFQETYCELVEQLLYALQCPVDPRQPQEVGDKFKALTQALRRANSRTTLDLSQVSPALAERGSWLVTIPGVSCPPDQEAVTIQAFVPEIDVLRTKTRPKKLVMVGSDGNNYSYLLKGNEDLHLDERIMQLLRVVNDLLSRETTSVPRCLRARHYAVIPMSGHSGLIQWVADATPLFRLVTDAATVAAAAAADPAPAAVSEEKVEGTTKSVPQRRVLPPAAQFQAKIVPALKNRGVAADSSRKDWPGEVLKSVFRELRDESPSGLLEKELWHGSSGAADWWARKSAYARSVAVMSVVGYVIGLGDRHLDNILCDARTGEVVHIDYNVCFDRGLKLKVPELVPFRLTKMMTEALGITGVEGHFRVASEQTLWVMRRHRETLVTLLEAFVYDPLVDWEVEHVDHEERKMMETNANLAVLSGRVAMLKGHVNRACAATCESFGTLQGLLRTGTDLCKQCTSTSQDVIAAELQTPQHLREAAPHPSLGLIGFGLEDAQTEHTRLIGALRAFEQECVAQLGRCSTFVAHLKGGAPLQATTALDQLAVQRYPLQRCIATVAAIHASVRGGASAASSSLPTPHEILELTTVSERLDNAALAVLRDSASVLSVACASIERYRQHLESLRLLDGYERHSVYAVWATWIPALLQEGEAACSFAHDAASATDAPTDTGRDVRLEFGGGQLHKAQSCIDTMGRLHNAGQSAQQMSAAIRAVERGFEDAVSTFGASLSDIMLAVGADPRAAWRAVAVLDAKVADALKPAGAEGPGAARKLWDDLCQSAASGDAMSLLIAMCSGVVESFVAACCALRAACVTASAQHSITGSTDMLECRVDLIRSILRMLQNNAKPQGLQKRLPAHLEHALSTFLGSAVEAAVHGLNSKLAADEHVEAKTSFDSVVRQLHEFLPLSTTDTTGPMVALAHMAGVLDDLHSHVSRDTACLQWLNDGYLRRFAMHNGRTPFTAPRDDVTTPLVSARDMLRALISRASELQASAIKVASDGVQVLRRTCSRARTGEFRSALAEQSAAQDKRSGWWDAVLRVLQQCSDDVDGALAAEGSLVAMRGFSASADGVDTRGKAMVLSFERTLRAIIQPAGQQNPVDAHPAQGDQGLGADAHADSTDAGLSTLERAVQAKSAAEVAIALHLPQVWATVQEALDASDDWKAKYGAGGKTLKAEVDSVVEGMLKLTSTNRTGKRLAQFREDVAGFQREFGALRGAESSMAAIVAPRATAYDLAKLDAESTAEQVSLAVDAMKGLVRDLHAAHGDFLSKMGDICEQSGCMAQNLARISEAALSLVADGELEEAPAACARGGQGTTKAAQAKEASSAVAASASSWGRNFDQERSSYALNLVRRVKGKLEGRADCIATCASQTAEGAASPSAKLNVQEQVDLLIQQATSEDNLSRMFEGWTPWI